MEGRGVRIQKLLANEGVGSRREVERWIADGRIGINGRIARPGDCYRKGDTLTVDGRPVRLKPGLSKVLVLMYYKPEGEVTTRSDEKGRKTVFDGLPECPRGRWISVGRLDINTTGLLLLTNHGELANRLMHPRYRILRKYAVRVRGVLSDEQAGRLLRGVDLEDGPGRFESLEDAGGQGSNHWYHVTLREGRNREVRRMWESQGLQVSRLIRIGYGPVPLDSNLSAGEHRELQPGEINRLLNEVGLPPIPRQPGKKTRRRIRHGR